MLGENYLNAEISALKNGSRVYPARYHDIQRELHILAPLLKQNATDSAHCYQFTLDASVKKERPKSLLILMLAVLLGGMVGVGITLVRHALAQYDSRGLQACCAEQTLHKELSKQSGSTV